MIEIDGSHGEGGGQILRTAVALSAVTGEAVKVRNIRAGRANPGLAPSHITSIEAVAEICGADVDGLFPGSKEIAFRPGQLVGGEFEFDVGTAGSISLVAQCCLLPALLSKTKVRMTLKGGTDVKWSPPIDYMRLVLLPVLDMMGSRASLEIVSRGFYPEGGGETLLETWPSGQFACLDLSTRGRVLSITGTAFAQNLPEHVVARMRHAALKRLLEFKEVRIESDLRRGRSTGAGIVLAAICEKSVIGSSALGARGVRSEALGDECAAGLLETLRSGASVDEYLLDQLLPYMALAGSGSCMLAEEITSHAETNMWVIEQFLGSRFEVEVRDGLTEVRVV
ncbi:MAG: RNA 3'-terminal phosphate cyclase [Thermoplasmata archaeon]